jgi:tetratricopeptide (TPR) repeat protein
MLYRRGHWIARALESFQTSVALDPDYALAWAGIAESYTALSYSGVRRPDLVMPAAARAARRATRLDPECAEAHNALALVALLWERHFDEAELAFRRALTLNPRYTHARCLYAIFLLEFTRLRNNDSLVEAQRARDDDPLSSFASTMLAFSLAGAARLDEALVCARHAVQCDPDSFLARWQSGVVHYWCGQLDEAIAILEVLWAESGHNWAALSLAPAYVKVDRVESARRVFDTLLRRRENEYIPPVVLAVCASVLGDREAAIAFCEECVETRDMTMAVLLRWWPDLDQIRADPRFEEIANRFDSR